MKTELAAPVRMGWDRGMTMSFEEALVMMGIYKRDIIARFGDWVVTAYGVECLATYYPIEASVLWNSYPWERHLSEKTWVKMKDAKAALAYGREYHANKRRGQ